MLRPRRSGAKWLVLLAALVTVRSGTARAPNTLTQKLIAASTGCDALEVHLSLAEGHQSVQVAWRTHSADCESTVQYGVSDTTAVTSGQKASASLLHTVVGLTYSITEASMCAAPASAKPFSVHMHVAVLSDLVPDTSYWYKVGGSLRRFTFRSPIRRGLHNSTSAFSFIAYGDMGQAKTGPKAKKTHMAATTIAALVDEVEKRPVNLITHVGDLAYADGKYKKWDSFLEEIEPVAANIPYMVAVGNHEGTKVLYRPTWGNYGPENGGECGAMMVGRMPMPAGPTKGGNTPFWYSFDYGPAHFTFISTEHDLSPGSEQYRWLARDLAGVDRCVTPWLVVALHRPMYVVYPHKDNRIVGEHIRGFIEDLLLKYDVDVTLAGHVHTYFRTCAVAKGTCMSDGSGITHFVIGTAGHELSSAADEQRAWVAANLNDYGFVRFDVQDDRMHARFIRSLTGEVADEKELVAKIYSDDECAAMATRRPADLAALEHRLADLERLYSAAGGG